MLLLIEQISLLFLVFILSLPIILFSKYFEKIIQPKKNFKRFAFWIVSVLFVSIIYFYLATWVYYKFIFTK